MDIDTILHKLEKNYNFHPGRRYRLRTIQVQETSNGGEIWIQNKYQPARHIHLPRDPSIGYGIYDLRTKEDFFEYFESEFGNLPDGKYYAKTSRGGNDGQPWFFYVELRNGRVYSKSWRKKSNGKEYGASSSYFMFPQYFRLREKFDV